MKSCQRAALFGFGIAFLGALITVTILATFYRSESSYAIATLVDERWDDLRDSELDDAFRLRDVFADLSFLAQECEYALDQDRELRELGHLFGNLAESTRCYDQVRFLGSDGMEVLRINWSDSLGAELVPPEELQNKGNRYYFRESINLKKGEIYASELDLNVENGFVERPPKPMLRLASTVRAPTGEVFGVVVLNFLAERILRSANDVGLMELDPRGDWMAGGHPEDLWGRQLGHGRSFADEFPEIWAEIRDSESTEIFQGDSLFLSRRFSMAEQFPQFFPDSEDSPTWYMVRYVEDVVETSGAGGTRRLLLWIAALSCLSWAVGGIILGRLFWYRCESIEALKSSKQEAESANRAKSQFLAAMSHEIRTPMNGVLGMAQILEMTSLDKDQAEYVEVIKSSGDTLLGIIDDILDYSKIEAGRLSIEAVEDNPQEILRKTIQLLSGKAAEKGLSLETDLDDSLPEKILCDSVRVRQILFNLIGNAIKFTEKGFVRVKAGSTLSETGAEGIRIEVVDSGIGMTTEQMERLFRPFSQADSSITRRFGGTGLGLTISKRLAKMMGGKIEVSSVIGEGSTFSVWLPLILPNAGSDSATTTLSHAEKSELIEACAKLSGEVLIVDDDRVNRMVLANLLAGFKIKTDVAENGTSALARAREKNYRLIFLDIRMPDMDGYEVADRILAESDPSTAPVIVAVSASVLPEEQNISFEHGMSGFIAKPVRVERLQEVLRKIL